MRPSEMTKAMCRLTKCGYSTTLKLARLLHFMDSIGNVVLPESLSTSKGVRSNVMLLAPVQAAAEYQHLARNAFQ
ncbi:hypothetical protein EVAR_91967_1 [Eumeta japonica]|uniref:Uncharacterized protein n=1 Tax=Eumeta variegata TaxID=151549 RepID=A0A4C1SF77_EUMVA|nr:hypothetical protein EVAR_91967_1 [Eumeta japonica]